MAKKKEEFVHDDSQEIQKEHIDKFEKYAQDFDNEQDLLLGLRAISLQGENNTWAVCEYIALKGSICPVTGLKFTNDTPFSLYSDLIEAMKNRARKRAYAEKKKNEEYERMGASLAVKDDL